MIVIAVSLFSPRLVPPLAAVAGWPLERLRRLIGRLARENAQRNPSRTAVTAAALMIGLALVTFVTVFAAGLKSSVAQVVDENFAGGLVIQNSDGFSPIPNGTATAARKVPGVDLVATIRSAQAKLVGSGAGARVSAPTPDIEEAGQGRMEEGRAGDPARPLATTRRSSPTPSPPNTASKSATASACSARRAGGRRFEVAGEFYSKLGVFGERADHAGGDGAGVRPDPGHDRLRRDRSPGADAATVQALLTKRRRSALSRPPKS